MAINLRGVASDALDWAGDLAQRALKKIGGYAKESVVELASSVNAVSPNMLPTATAALAEMSFRGSQGNFATTVYPIVLKCEFLRTADPLPERYGFPCNEFKALGSVDGFVLCKDAQIKISGTIDEEDVVRQFLNNGVYLDWTRVPVP